jgi:hypothetical protein
MIVYFGRNMPQIRCPNCGVTINLENRKKTDYDLIVGSLKKGPKTFTQLLRKTHLPRKTLNIRLKGLINSGIIVKDGDYHLTDSPQTIEFQAKYSSDRIHNLKSKAIHFIKDNPKGNRDAVLIIAFFALLMIGVTRPFMVTGHCVHKIDTGSIISDATFEVKISITNAVDLYSWQGKITYDPSILKVVDVAVGDFLSADTIVINATDEISSISASSSVCSILIFTTDAESEGVLLIGGSLLGKVQGSYGEGTLSTITFSVVDEEMETINANLGGGIILLNSDLSDAKGTLKAEV